MGPIRQSTTHRHTHVLHQWHCHFITHTLFEFCVQILPRQVPVPMTFNRTELKALQVQTHKPTPVVCLLSHMCTPAHHQDKVVRDRAVARRRELVNRFNRKLKPLFRKLFRGATDAELAEHATAVGLLVVLSLSPHSVSVLPTTPSPTTGGPPSLLTTTTGAVLVGHCTRWLACTHHPRPQVPGAVCRHVQLPAS